MRARAAPSFETRAGPAPQDEAAQRMPTSWLIAEPLAFQSHDVKQPYATQRRGAAP
jgi:hypothetical protein